MKITVLWNAKSGRGADGVTRRRCLEHLAGPNRDIVLHVPAARGELTRLARESALAGVDAVIAAGGDGTVNEVANGLIEVPDWRGSFGVIPTGTVNVWARSLGIPLDILGAADAFLKGKDRAVTVGRFAERHFLFAAGVGFDAAVVSNEQPRLKKLIGRYSYYARTAAMLWTYEAPRLEVRVDGGRPMYGESLIIGKTPLYGDRFYLTPNADPFDDVLDVCLFRNFGPAIFTRVTAASLTRGATLRDPDLWHGRGRVIEVSSPDSPPVQLDGEVHGRLPARVEAVPGRLAVRLGPC